MPRPGAAARPGGEDSGDPAPADQVELLVDHADADPVPEDRLLVYATVSVTAQELLFSSFFYWRYRDLASPGRLDVLNVAAFGFAHLVYGSWISVGLSLLGRVVLVRVYRRHGNVWGVWVLHLALGTLVFAVGLGPYFYRPLAASAWTGVAGVAGPATGKYTVNVAPRPGALARPM